MADLSTKFLGLSLNNPLIIASSGLTDTPEKISELAANGAAAVVLKSIFEEEITMEYDKMIEDEQNSRYKDEYLDYFDYRIKEENLNKHLNLLKEAKKAVDIPIIASINCKSAHEWTYFAKKFEEFGADALELNIALLPTDLSKSHTEYEQVYFDTINQIQKKINIPVSLKISPYAANLAQFIQKLSKSGINGLVLFNRFYNPDIDLDKLSITSSNIFSAPHDFTIPLRWVAMMSKRVSCDLAASTGIHDGASVIKQLLAGAKAVEIASVIYKNGPSYIGVMLEQIDGWMQEKSFTSIADFNGKLSQKDISNPEVFERIQFMKYFSDRKDIN